MLFKDKPGFIRLVQFRTGYYMLCQVKPCYTSIGKVCPGKLKSGHVWPYYVMLEKFRQG